MTRVKSGCVPIVFADNPQGSREFLRKGEDYLRLTAMLTKAQKTDRQNGRSLNGHNLVPDPVLEHSPEEPDV